MILVTWMKRERLDEAGVILGGMKIWSGATLLSILP